MAYDLHLVRTNDWLDAADVPVTKADVDALILSDAELSWSADYVDMQVDGEVKRFHLIDWKGEPFFWWYQDQIKFNSPDQSALIKLVRMAETLNAVVVGDDGEHYALVLLPNGDASVSHRQLQETEASTPTVLSKVRSFFKR
ncbi:hypothetical protein F3J24_18040 [Comamonas sp. Tr-654]|uniref:hypothetical protein n=1 Tax=Comamonas sp. Tr-654 TaxID=2608341 RepID=UPI001423A2DB|nr:hypothetical protein [Comamonas sp. Tr-654]NIF85411.1 hypothetical protein [Comamonas sp. Tr-654]